MVKKIFSIFKKSSKDFKPEYFTTDLHSHLIPGIDDGVKTLDESIEIIKQLKDLGFTKIITTPHIMAHKYKNTREIILNGCQLVKEELKKREIDIELVASAEYYFDENFLELIEKDDLLFFGKDKYVLFELSYTSKPFGLEQTIFNLLSKGYRPILAHPERYSFFSSNFSKYDLLKESGVRFQLNLNSLYGFYGKNTKAAAKYLVENALVDFVGSDIHGERYLDFFSKAIFEKETHELFEKNSIKNYKL